MRQFPSRLATLLALVWTLAVPVTAWGHGLGIECRVRGDRVEVETFFEDDTPAENARVVITDEAGNTIAEGQTDSAGRWAFPLPGAGTYRVAVNAGRGHAARTRLHIPGGVPADGVRVSEGPSRQEFTRFPLAALLAGLAMITAAAVVMRLLMHRTRATPSQ